MDLIGFQTRRRRLCWSRIVFLPGQEDDELKNIERSGQDKS
jgi:hypothetical protein